VGTAYPSGYCRRRLGQTAEFNGYYVSAVTATHNAHLACYFLFEQFQIGLPPEQIAIILHTDWHRTGGCHPIPKSELPP
jgi:hypothetical protein